MQTRPLGASGLQVPELSLGTMTFGGRGRFRHVGETDVEQARRIVDVSLDHGIRLFDTADVYSAGASEEILGLALKGKRDQAMIATKACGLMGPGPNDRGLSRHHLLRACEASLRRLGTDYIDLYQAHAWDGRTPLEETLSAFDDLVRAGKVRYVGCSNFSAWHLMKALWTSDRCGFESFVSQQVYYSLAAREAEYELVPIALDQGAGILAWSPLAGGLLAGKARGAEQAPQQSRAQTAPWALPRTHDAEREATIVKTAERIASQRGRPVAQVAINYLRRKAGVATVIFGARDEEQLITNLAAAEWSLDDAELQALDEVSEPPLLYPYWHQQMSTDRLARADRWPR